MAHIKWLLVALAACCANTATESRGYREPVCFDTNISLVSR
jgi:hypothetical protein